LFIDFDHNNKHVQLQQVFWLPHDVTYFISSLDLRKGLILREISPRKNIEKG